MKKNILSLTILTGLLLSPKNIFAQLVNPLRAEGFAELINLIIGFLWNFGIILAVLIILIGAFHILTSAGDPKKFETGKKIIIYTLIGLLIIIIARGLVDMIIGLVT